MTDRENLAERIDQAGSLYLPKPLSEGGGITNLQTSEKDLIVAALRDRPAPVGLGEEELCRMIAKYDWPYATAAEQKEWADDKWKEKRQLANAILDRLASQPQPEAT